MYVHIKHIEDLVRHRIVISTRLKFFSIYIHIYSVVVGNGFTSICYFFSVVSTNVVGRNCCEGPSSDCVNRCVEWDQVVQPLDIAEWDYLTVIKVNLFPIYICFGRQAYYGIPADQRYVYCSSDISSRHIRFTNSNSIRETTDCHPVRVRDLYAIETVKPVLWAWHGSERNTPYAIYVKNTWNSVSLNAINIFAFECAYVCVRMCLYAYECIHVYLHNQFWSLTDNPFHQLYQSPVYYPRSVDKFH